RIVGRVVGSHQEIYPAQPVARGAKARVQLVVLHLEAPSIVAHFEVANGLGAQSRVVGLDAPLGFMKQSHEVRQGGKAVGAEADPHVDRAVRGLLAEDLCHTSNKMLSVTVERPVDAKCGVRPIDCLQATITRWDRVDYLPCPRAPVVWFAPLPARNDSLQPR